jgi:hypothetical protein
MVSHERCLTLVISPTIHCHGQNTLVTAPRTTRPDYRHPCLYECLTPFLHEHVPSLSESPMLCSLNLSFHRFSLVVTESPEPRYFDPTGYLSPVTLHLYHEVPTSASAFPITRAHPRFPILGGDPVTNEVPSNGVRAADVNVTTIERARRSVAAAERGEGVARGINNDTVTLSGFVYGASGEP